MSLKPSIQVMPSKNLPAVELRRGRGVIAPVPRHWHAEYQICCIRGGAGTVTYRGTTLSTPPQSLFVIHPGEMHSNECTAAEGCDYETIFIDPALLSEDLPLLEQAVIHDAETIGHFSRAFSGVESGQSKLESEFAVMLFLSDLVAKHGAAHAPTPGQTHSGLALAMRHLQANFVRELPLSELAEIAGLNSFHFCRQFSAEFGAPPHLFQIQLRVVRAKALLQEGRPIGEVALEVGFADQSHLNRHFRRLTAVTPGQYAKTSKTRR